MVRMTTITRWAVKQARCVHCAEVNAHLTAVYFPACPKTSLLGSGFGSETKQLCFPCACNIYSKIEDAARVV